MSMNQVRIVPTIHDFFVVKTKIGNDS